MKIKGIGVVKKKEVLSVLTNEEKDSFKKGMLSTKEAGTIYKLEKVKALSAIGAYHDTFSANYNRIPEALQERLAPQELAELTDAFYKCYSAGKASK